MTPKSESKRWVVQKFGGTSVGKLLDAVTGNIIPDYLREHNVAVVCSARSGESKSSGTTSLLLKAISSATANETSAAPIDDIINAIKDDHLQAARSIDADDSRCLESETILQVLQDEITEDCERLRKFLHATWTVGEIAEHTKDRVLSVGERLACRIVAASLRSKGIEAAIINLEDVVQDRDSRRPTEQKMLYRQNPLRFLQDLSTAVGKRIYDQQGKVPVITGFFGTMPESLIESVGRGYSDLCGALCAVSVAAQEYQIWKEVDGIFTADPNKVSSARVLATVTSEEAAELTYYGSEVIHPLTMSLLGSADIILRLKNVKNSIGTGTVIYPSSALSPHPPTTPTRNGCPGPSSTFMATNGYYGDGQKRRTPTAITVKEPITLIHITSNGKLPPQAFLGQIAERLGRDQVTIDLISTGHRSVSLAVPSQEPGSSIGPGEHTLAMLEEMGSTMAQDQMCIISVVGHRMRNMVGVASEIFSALARARINIYLISQGASEINISFVVKMRDAVLAMDVVHSQVLRIPGHAERENSLIKGPWLY